MYEFIIYGERALGRTLQRPQKNLTAQTMLEGDKRKRHHRQSERPHDLHVIDMFGLDPVPKSLTQK